MADLDLQEIALKAMDEIIAANPNGTEAEWRGAFLDRCKSDETLSKACIKFYFDKEFANINRSRFRVVKGDES